MKKLLKLSILITLIHAPIYAQWNIAVLPHENTLGDPQWNWLSAAIVEGYINAYYHVPKIHAVDEEYLRHKLGDTPVSSSDLAKKLDIHLILSGRYHIAGSRIQIETDMLQASTGEVIETFTGQASTSAPLDAILPVLYAITDQLNVTLTPHEKTRLQMPMFHDAEALRLATESMMALHRALRQSPIDDALLTQAEGGLKRAVQRDAKSAMPHYYLGRIYETRNKITEAENTYRNALKIDFEHVVARYRLALLLKRRGRTDEAMSELEQAIQQSPINPDIQAALSGMFFNQYAQTFETITSQLRQAIQANPDDPIACYELANAYNELDRIDEATDYYHQALQRDSTLADAHFKLGLIAHRKGEHEKAVDHLQKAAAHNTQFTRVHFRLGTILHLIERHDAAIKAFTKAIEVEPNYVIPRYHLGLSYLATEQTDSAYEAFQKYADLTSDDHRPHFQMAEIARQKGEYERAHNGYMRAITISPVHVPSHIHLGYLHAEQQRFDLAVQQLQTALRLQPDHPDAEKILADIQEWTP